MRRSPQQRLLVASVTVAALALGAAEARPPRSLIFAFDTSGSLAADDLEAAREVARAFLAAHAPGDRFGVLSFDDRPRLLAPLGSAEPELDAALAELAIGGRHTTLHDALFDAAGLLADEASADRAIVAFTDGRDEMSALTFEDAEKAVEEAGTAVFPIGVGDRIDERFMRRFAKLTGGRYLPPETLADAPQVIDRIDEILRQRAAAAAAARPTTEPVAPTPSAAAAELAAPPPQPPDRAPAAKPAASNASDPDPVGGRRGLPPWAVPAAGATAVIAAILWRRRRSHDAATAATDDGDLEGPLVAGAGPPRPAFTTQPEGPLETAPGLVSDDTASGEATDRTFLLSEKPVLQVRRGRNVGESFLLKPDGDTYIGRAQMNDIALNDKSISSRHIRFRVEGQVRTALDLGSTNGSFHNDHRMHEEVYLETGDVIRLGETELVFTLEQRRE